jgi:hypothetical protein
MMSTAVIEIKGMSGKWHRRTATACRVLGIRVWIHRDLSPERSLWTITDAKTGGVIANGETPRKARICARERIRFYGGPRRVQKYQREFKRLAPGDHIRRVR